MVDQKYIHTQLKKIKFGGGPWNQAELRELPNIIHEGEKISECVNGFYEGGVALLVATDMRLLLIDKKPMKFLTVEDFRFDMISEIDYSHRLVNAMITISTGSKTLRFTSLNHARLRHFIGLVQEHMSNSKKEQSDKAETQQQHLQEINKQLQMYLMAQHQQLQQQLLQYQSGGKQQTTEQQADIPKPSPQLSDYLFAQQLLEKFQNEQGPLAETTQSDQSALETKQSTEIKQPAEANHSAETQESETVAVQPAGKDVLAEARQEIFGHRQASSQQSNTTTAAPSNEDNPAAFFKGLEVNPLRIAYSRLPMMLRNRKFGRPSFHAHSEQQTLPTGGQIATT